MAMANTDASPSTVRSLGLRLLDVMENVTTQLIQTLGETATQLIRSLETTVNEVVNNVGRMATTTLEGARDVFLQLITSLPEMCRDPNVLRLITNGMTTLRALIEHSYEAPIQN